MRRHLADLIFDLLVALALLLAPAAAPAAPRLEPAALAGIEEIVHREIAAGRLPGAVVLIGDADGPIYRRAFGDRQTRPTRLPMATDAIFDLASLTKAVATATAVMQLVEQGRLDLDTPAARYWPEFGGQGKAGITLRHLLTHQSGLRADLDLRPPWKGRETAFRLILEERPRTAPGARQLYSDINFLVLGEIVERVSGMPLDAYCRQHIFAPLGMADTGFRPVDPARVAPTEGGISGTVHDPTARRMGGVAGHAGLFSTADDLARFARMLLAGGQLDGARILRPDSVEAMSLPPQFPPLLPTHLPTLARSDPGDSLRGLGWELAAPFAANRAALPPAGAYGHTGFTGTALWIDPVQRLYLILLGNRVHPDGRGDAKPLRAGIAAALGDALGKLSEAELAAARPALADFVAVHLAATPQVQSGLDLLVGQNFAPLRGKRIGLITNHTGRDARGRRGPDLLAGARGVRLVALFSPEHGFSGDRDEPIRSGAEPASGLPIHSLYGAVKRPTPEMLKDLDALVFDIQDAGARFYTYITTLAYAMEAAAQAGIPIFVLDRPNPITADVVQGPMLDPDRTSFTGYHPMPVRHGMTVAELARFFNAEARVNGKTGIGADLRIVPMRGYDRQAWYDQTGLPWINPSPNLRSLAQATLYPGVALVEGANVSVGRGTEAPFEVLGAPWIDGRELATHLGSRALPGVRFEAAEFTPADYLYKGQPCQGVRLTVTDRDALDSPALGIEIAAALHRLYPGDFRLDATLGSIGSEKVLTAIREGVDPRAIAAGWRDDLADFRARRARYLLY